MTKTDFIAEPGVQEITLIREFDAPRELVFKTFTNPELFPEWWGPGYLTTTVEQMTLRPGGAWRVVQRDPEGNVYAFKGFYHHIQPPERLVYTFEFEGASGHILLETVTFEALPGGRTRITDQSVFQSVEDRDGMMAEDMESGAIETMERLAGLLRKVAGKGN